MNENLLFPREKTKETAALSGGRLFWSRPGRAGEGRLRQKCTWCRPSACLAPMEKCTSCRGAFWRRSQDVPRAVEVVWGPPEIYPKVSYITLVTT